MRYGTSDFGVFVRPTFGREWLFAEARSLEHGKQQLAAAIAEGFSSARLVDLRQSIDWR